MAPLSIFKQCSRSCTEMLFQSCFIGKFLSYKSRWCAQYCYFLAFIDLFLENKAKKRSVEMLRSAYAFIIFSLWWITFIARSTSLSRNLSRREETIHYIKINISQTTRVRTTYNVLVHTNTSGPKIGGKIQITSQRFFHLRNGKRHGMKNFFPTHT